MSTTGPHTRSGVTGAEKFGIEGKGETERPTIRSPWRVSLNTRGISDGYPLRTQIGDRKFRAVSSEAPGREVPPRKFGPCGC